MCEAEITAWEWCDSRPGMDLHRPLHTGSVDGRCCFFCLECRVLNCRIACERLRRNPHVSVVHVVSSKNSSTLRLWINCKTIDNFTAPQLKSERLFNWAYGRPRAHYIISVRWFTNKVIASEKKNPPRCSVRNCRCLAWVKLWHKPINVMAELFLANASHSHDAAFLRGFSGIRIDLWLAYSRRKNSAYLGKP